MLFICNDWNVNIVYINTCLLDDFPEPKPWLIDTYLLAVCSDKTMVNKHLLTVLVRLFLEQNDNSTLKFVAEFAKQTMSDEKVIMQYCLYNDSNYWLDKYFMSNMLHGNHKHISSY